jgi:hypothetical protein
MNHVMRAVEVRAARAVRAVRVARAVRAARCPPVSVGAVVAPRWL